jgi:hypothetical protein
VAKLEQRRQTNCFILNVIAPWEQKSKTNCHLTECRGTMGAKEKQIRASLY